VSTIVSSTERGTAGLREAADARAIGFEFVLQQTREVGAAAPPERQHLVGARDQLDGLLARLPLQGLRGALEVGERFVQRCGHGLLRARRALQIAAQALDRREDGLEAARQFSAELRVAVEAHRPREAVRGGGRDRHFAGELVDVERGRPKRMRKHRLPHAPQRRGHRRDACGDLLEHGQAGEAAGPALGCGRCDHE
jgi:hypothetical protein